MVKVSRRAFQGRKNFFETGLKLDRGGDDPVNSAA
jgi:hypothetical protein